METFQMQKNIRFRVTFAREEGEKRGNCENEENKKTERQLRKWIQSNAKIKRDKGAVVLSYAWCVKFNKKFK